MSTHQGENLQLVHIQDVVSQDMFGQERNLQDSQNYSRHLVNRFIDSDTKGMISYRHFEVIPGGQHPVA